MLKILEEVEEMEADVGFAVHFRFLAIPCDHSFLLLFGDLCLLLAIL